jgi:hypothetical protein
LLNFNALNQKEQQLKHEAFEIENKRKFAADEQLRIAAEQDQQKLQQIED